MAALFRRKSADLVTDPVTEATESAPATSDRPNRSKGYTPKKGEATPKRADPRRKPEAPAANRKEALKRTRDRQRAERAEARAGMMRGEERHLLPRDKGPIRGLARDVIDSRRNAATFFFVGLFVVLVGSSRGFPQVVQISANTLFIVLFAATVVDTVLIIRKVRRLARERYPTATEGSRGLGFYIVMRTISFRRLRIPKPRVKVGESI